MKNQFSAPILIKQDSESVLERLPLGVTGETTYNEYWLQALLYSHPQALPIDEIDQSYESLIPICREMNTPAGPVDVLYATPQGKLVILEAKLWRNPEARRKVIGQILDYAKEISRWSYEDLQREISRAVRNEIGEARKLFDIIKEKCPDSDEAQFIDSVSRNLRKGEFLLLIVGDGIREGVASIAEFLENKGTLNFTFGLVEMAIYKIEGETLLVQPRVIAQSMIVKRTVITLDSEGLIATEDGEEEISTPEISDLQKFYMDFWQEFIAQLTFDDQSQPLPNPTKKGNLFLEMPTKNASWITLYFLQQNNEVGVFLTFRRGAFGDAIYERLLQDKISIEDELKFIPQWNSSDGKHSIATSKNFPDLKSQEHRESIKAWLADISNRYVNVFRPRIQKIKEET